LLRIFLILFDTIYIKYLKNNKLCYDHKTIKTILRGRIKMENHVIELLKPITLKKENCSPLIFETARARRLIGPR